MKRLVVVGGGIAGLAAARGAVEAWDAARGLLEVTVLEREAAIGGKAASVRREGYLVETGPTGYLDNEPAVDRLVAAAGLTKLAADQAAARRFLVRGGRMREAAAHPLKFAASGILSPLGILRVAGEFFVPGKTDGGDESVWDFAARRIGREGADRLIAPMMLGVFAGDAKRLSLPAALPRMREIEERYGSLFKGLIAIRRAGKKNAAPGGPSGTLTSFEGGLAELPRRLAERGGFAVRTGAAVAGIDPHAGGGFAVRLAGGGAPLAADAVVLTGEPWAMAPLLAPLAPDAARAWGAIPCPPVAVVALGYGPEELARAPRGFGVLIPRGEGYRILGVLWDTFLFAGRSPDGRLLVRTMLGGGVDPSIGDLAPDAIAAIAREEVARLMGLRSAPVFEHTVLWQRAIPQYELGHRERVAAVEGGLAAHPGLFAAGNGLYGIAFSKAAASGLSTGERASLWLQHPAQREADRVESGR